VDDRQEVNHWQRRVGDEKAMGGIRLQTLLPPLDRGRCLQSSLLPLELPAALHNLQPPPDPSTSSRSFDLLQILRPPPDPSTASSPFDRFQSFLPSSELPAISEAFDRFQSPPDFSTTSRPSCRLQSFLLCFLRSLLPPLELPAILQSFVFDASGAFDLFQCL
jgi:hypothetical protein